MLESGQCLKGESINVLYNYLISKMSKNIDYLEDFSAHTKTNSEEFAMGKLVYNFSPGPCVLPRAVLDKCQEGMIDYKGSGQSVMELSHRKPEFVRISDMTKTEIRRFLGVPDNYTIMLNQGGATN